MPLCSTVGRLPLNRDRGSLCSTCVDSRLSCGVVDPVLSSDDTVQPESGCPGSDPDWVTTQWVLSGSTEEPGLSFPFCWSLSFGPTEPMTVDYENADTVSSLRASSGRGIVEGQGGPHHKDEW